jgi:hypothetical protein
LYSGAVPEKGRFGPFKQPLAAEDCVATLAARHDVQSAVAVEEKE